MNASLILGGGIVDRKVSDAELLLADYKTDDGTFYLDYPPATPPDCLCVEDLAVTLLVNSRATGNPAKSLIRFGATVDLSTLPTIPLEQTDSDQRRSVAELIAKVASWPGFAASTATKVMHKKRPALIPVLDNQAIFGAYLNPAWPATRSSQDSEKRIARILQALEAIYFDLTRVENATAWPIVQSHAPTRTRIQLFDSVWWMHFRKNEPVARPVRQ